MGHRHDIVAYRLIGPVLPDYQLLTEQRDKLLTAAKEALRVFEDQGWADDLLAAQRLKAAIDGCEQR